MGSGVGIWGEDADGEQWMEVSLGVAPCAAASKMELRKRDAPRARGAEPLARKGAEESRGCHPALHSETPPGSSRWRLRRAARAFVACVVLVRLLSAQFGVLEPFS